MEIVPLVTPPLGHAGYLVVHGGEAVAVDPLRDCAGLAAALLETGARLRWITQTHLPEDHLGGVLELAGRTGAEVALPSRAAACFPHRALRGGDELRFGGAVLRALDTPGHGPEAMCYAAEAPGGEPAQLMTGGTLVVGDSARVDHLGSGEERAAELFESLRHLASAVPPTAVIWAGHRAGALCVRRPSEEIRSTLAEELGTNAALRCRNPEELARHILAGQHEIPMHYARLREANRQGPPQRPAPPPPLPPAAFRAAVGAGAVALDVRSGPDYDAAHVPGILHIGLEGQLEWWAGSLVPPDRPIALVAPRGRLEETLDRLARVGFDRIAGALEGGMEAWSRAGFEVRTAEPLDPGAALSRVRAHREVQFLDVRRAWEWEEVRAPGTRLLPLHELAARAGELDPSRPVAAVCRGGYRSSIAGSLLEAAGFTGLINVTGGMLAWLEQGVETETPAPSR